MIALDDIKANLYDLAKETNSQVLKEVDKISNVRCIFLPL